MGKSSEVNALIRGCNKGCGYLVLADYMEERGFWRIAHELRGISVGPEDVAEIGLKNLGRGILYGDSFGDGYSEEYGYGEGYGGGYGSGNDYVYYYGNGAGNGIGNGYGHGIGNGYGHGEEEGNDGY